MCGIALPLYTIRPGNKWTMFTQRGVIRYQVTVKLAPDQLIKLDTTGPTVQRLRLFSQQAMQALARR